MKKRIIIDLTVLICLIMLIWFNCQPYFSEKSADRDSNNSGNDILDDTDIIKASTLTFIVSKVEDGLDSEDMTIMSNGLSGMGYARITSDSNVSRSEMISYLQQSVGVYYHTGHGFDSGIATSDSDVVVGQTTVYPENTIFATCLTLTSTSWKNYFGSTAQSILGYTNYSYDYADNDIANDFLSQLRGGKSFPAAWYVANNAYSLVSDRWCCYVREGTSINEYSARRGTVPKSLSSSYILAGKSKNIYIDSSVLSKSLNTNFTSLNKKFLRSKSNLQTHAEFKTLKEVFKSSMLTSDQAISAVEKFMNKKSSKPSDAVFDKVITIQRITDKNPNSETVGHVVKYVRKIGNMMIRSNFIEDHLSFLVGSGGNVELQTSYWPGITEKTADQQKSGYYLSEKELLSAAAENISELIKECQKVYIADIIPVYGTIGPRGRSNELIPAYACICDDGTKIIVDAKTGEIVK